MWWLFSVSFELIFTKFQDMKKSNEVKSSIFWYFLYFFCDGNDIWENHLANRQKNATVRSTLPHMEVLPLIWRVLEMSTFRTLKFWKTLVACHTHEPWTPLFGDFSLLCITCSFHLPYLFCCFIPLESFGIIIYVTCFSFAVQLFSIRKLFFFGAAEHGERGGPLTLWRRDYFTPCSANCRMHLTTLHKLNPISCNF